MKIGKCSVPMWCMGLPAGFCGENAFGVQTKYYLSSHSYPYNPPAYAPDLACPAHGGPKCPGIEIEENIYSGCDQSAGDCPTCNL